jgi:hypothetical protein
MLQNIVYLFKFSFRKKVLFVRWTRGHEDKQMTETSSTILTRFFLQESLSNKQFDEKLFITCFGQSSNNNNIFNDIIKNIQNGERFFQFSSIKNAKF